MATVADLSGNLPMSLVSQGKNTDSQTLCAPNRSYAGSPASVLTPQYRGEMITDTVSNQVWIAVGLTSSDWVAGMMVSS